jgi:hypothetical protein
LAKREGIGWRLGKKIYQKGGGPRIVGLFLAKDGSSHCSLFLIKRIGLGFLFALYFYL